MKTLKILFLSILLPVLIVFISCTGCENGLFNEDDNDNQDHTWEIQLNDDQKVIEQTVKGIEFKFCLLNEDSVPSTTFEEGENFYFYFSIANNRKDDLYIDHHKFFSKNFCMVFQENEGDFGKPFELVAVEDVMPAGNPFPAGSNIQLKIPWKDERNNWNTLHVIFEGLNRDFLSSGKYYTKFTNQFHFFKVGENSSITTDSLTFKINFEIK
jgi:hypothetical protein